VTLRHIGTVDSRALTYGDWTVRKDELARNMVAPLDLSQTFEMKEGSKKWERMS
jgi:hypothetical protein